MALSPVWHKVLVGALTIVGGSAAVLLHSGYLSTELAAAIVGISTVISGVINGTGGTPS